MFATIAMRFKSSPQSLYVVMLRLIMYNVLPQQTKHVHKGEQIERSRLRGVHEGEFLKSLFNSHYVALSCPILYRRYQLSLLLNT